MRFLEMPVFIFNCLSVSYLLKISESLKARKSLSVALEYFDNQFFPESSSVKLWPDRGLKITFTFILKRFRIFVLPEN